MSVHSVGLSEEDQFRLIATLGSSDSAQNPLLRQAPVTFDKIDQMPGMRGQGAVTEALSLLNELVASVGHRQPGPNGWLASLMCVIEDQRDSYGNPLTDQMVFVHLFKFE